MCYFQAESNQNTDGTVEEGEDENTEDSNMQVSETGLLIIIIICKNTYEIKLQMSLCNKLLSSNTQN